MRFTAGESLFRLIRFDVIDSLESSNSNWSSICRFLNDSTAGENYANYMRGAIAVNAVRRLLRYWKDERQLINNEAAYVKNLKRYIKDEVFPGLGDDMSGKLARAVIGAEEASFRPIGEGVRAAVLSDKKIHNCYLCDFGLDKSADESCDNHLTLEHLWPTSLGGNSVPENLIPACKRCQIYTKDTMSWEWLNVQNLILPKDPSDQALLAVTKKEQTARHFYNAFVLCDRENISLKQAFKRIGPMRKQVLGIRTGSPLTFFDLHTLED